MNEQAQKILVNLLQKASDGMDAAVSFSQAQIPDVIHQLLIWKFTYSMIMTIVAIATIPPVIWFVKHQFRKIENGQITNEGYSWDKGKTKYAPTLIWDCKGNINIAAAPLFFAFGVWAAWAYVTITKLVWLKIWLAPKLYLIEYAAQLVHSA